MKRLLRGVIDFGTIGQESLAYNYQRLHSSKIQWVQPADEKIYKFVKEFFESELDLPNAKVLADYYTRADDHECLERLKDIKSAPSYEGANYSFVLKGIVEDQNRIRLMTLIKETQEVASKGLVIEEGKNKKRIEGVGDAVAYFQQRATDLLQQDANSRTRGELRESAMDAKQDYQVIKANPSQAWGALTGIEIIDTACRGLKKGEMWVHAGFAGELKTTMALTWCYNLITRYRRNVFYASLEMPYKQIRNKLCCLHTSHPRWALQGKKPLDYRKIRDGQLTEEEEAFYFEALEDLYSNDEYARFELWCPDHDVSVSEVKIEAELLHKQMEVGFIVVDHGGLVKDPSKGGKNTTEELNAIMRDCKKLALHFNTGEGVPLLLLFQINRQGKDEATKSNGRYKLSALSYSNECLAAGTMVTTNVGLIPIEVVIPGMQVWSSTGWKPVLRHMSQGPRDTVTVQTHSGLEVVCTADHLFRVLGENGLEWCQAKDLPGRVCLTPLDAPPLFSVGPDLPSLEIAKYEKSCGEQGLPLRVVWPLGSVFLRVFKRYRRRWEKGGITFPRSCAAAALAVQKGRTSVPHRSILQMLETLEFVQGDSDLDYLRLVLTNYPQEVIAVTPGAICEVYDIEVSGDHEYCAGGLLTHNCERSADYVTTTYLDDTLREAGRTILCNLKNRDNPHFPVFEAGVDFTCGRIYSIDPGESMTEEANAEEVNALLEGV